VPIVAVVFGWPAVIASILLAVFGVAAGRSRLVLSGAVVACPFLIYLFMTPRLGWIVPPVAALFFLASTAVARGRRLTGFLLLAPYIGVVLFVAYLVARQQAG
jgi:hypothetical protein